MASLSHDPPESGDLQEAIKRIIKQHQRDCENAGEFGKARRARAALQELQHQSELEGLCRLFCKHYKQLSAAEKAYEKQLHTLDVNWQTRQLPDLLEKVRRWRQQLQQRQEDELAVLAPSTCQEERPDPRPRFKKEAFDLQKKVLFLGHQGRYDEAEELQKKLAAQQLIDAAQQKAVLKARRERQTRRLLTAQDAERRTLGSKVERLVSYHNKQNAEAIDVLRRKYLGQRRSLIHIQTLETQKYLHALESFTPSEAVRMASSVVSSQWKVQGKGACGVSSSVAEESCPRSTICLRSALVKEDEGRGLDIAAPWIGKVTKQKGQTAEVVVSVGNSQSTNVFFSGCDIGPVRTNTDRQGELRTKHRKPLSQGHGAPLEKFQTLTSQLTGASTCLPRLSVSLRKSLATRPPRPFHTLQNAESWMSFNSNISRNGGSQRSPANSLQDVKQRHSVDKLQGKRLTGRSVVRARSVEKGKPPVTDTLCDEIFEAWKECAAKVTKEQIMAESLR